MIRIPFHTSEQHTASLKSAIKRAADRRGVFPQAMAVTMSYFLEEVANQLAAGQPVRIPGFGLFAPVTKRHRTQGTLVTRVYFYPARAFTNIVAEGALPSDEGRRAYAAYQKRHHPSGRGKANHDVRTAMEAFRERIRKNAYATDLEYD